MQHIVKVFLWHGQRNNFIFITLKKVFFSSTFIPCIFFSWFWSETAIAQQSGICGFVLDSVSHEPLIGAYVIESDSKQCITDKNGYFCIEVSDLEKARLVFSYVGFKKREIRFSRQSVNVLKVFLAPDNSIDEVIITANSRKSGMIEIPVHQILKLPTLTGEPDLLKALQLMPGVQMGDEGSSGIYVRGGSPDQNLYLMDDVPLYYINHMGGFMSVFDVNCIKKATLYKSDFPARYGGRLSAVLDVRLKDGSSDKKSYEFMIGTMATKFFSEGPLKKKITYMISVRRSNIDLFMKPFTSLRSGGKEKTAYTFYDLNTKITWNPDDINKITGLIYSGRDKLSFAEKLGGDFSARSSDKYAISWGNFIGSFNWNHILNNGAMMETRIGYTNFFYHVKNDYVYNSQFDHFEEHDLFASGIGDFSLQSSVNLNVNKMSLNLGAGSVLHTFMPNYQKSKTESSDYNNSNHFGQPIFQPEIFIFAEDNWTISQKISFSTGFYFMTWPVIKKSTIDPRLSIKYKVTHSFLVQLSYSIMHQYMHLLSANGSGIPSDLWMPSTPSILPERADQIGIGFIYNYKGFEISMDMYYKVLKNLIMYKANSNLLNTVNWKQTIENSGKGTIKGMEFLIQKKYGKTTGWIGYTLSKNDRQFDNINQGFAFPYKYDRRHDFKLSLNQDLNKRISFSALWVFTTGNAITLATKHYPAIDFDNAGIQYLNFTMTDAHYYSGINNYRTASYHRLDIGFNFRKEKARYTRVFYVGVYNLYNRKNPYYYFYNTKKGQTQLYSYTLFPIIPSISYRINF